MGVDATIYVTRQAGVTHEHVENLNDDLDGRGLIDRKWREEFQVAEVGGLLVAFVSPPGRYHDPSGDPFRPWHVHRAIIEVAMSHQFRVFYGHDHHPPGGAILCTTGWLQEVSDAWAQGGAEHRPAEPGILSDLFSARAPAGEVMPDWVNALSSRLATAGVALERGEPSRAGRALADASVALDSARPDDE